MGNGAKIKGPTMAKHAVSQMVSAKETEGGAKLLRKMAPNSAAQQICDRSTQRLLLLGLNAWWELFVRSTTAGRVRWDRGLGWLECGVCHSDPLFHWKHALVVIASSSGTMRRLRGGDSSSSILAADRWPCNNHGC
jgi:hypothetical protein